MAKKKDIQVKDSESTNMIESLELAEALILPKVAMARVTLENQLRMT
jgi:hypothetical protein